MSLSSSQTLSSWSWLHTFKSVPIGKYCGSSPFVFSLVPRCQSECGSAKNIRNRWPSLSEDVLATVVAEWSSDSRRSRETISPWKRQTVAFFAVMHLCGLRICDVRRLQTSDVNVNESGIDVRWAKGQPKSTAFRTGSRGEIRNGHGCTVSVTHSTLRGKCCRS